MSWYCDRIVAVEDSEAEQCIYVMTRRSRIVAVEDSRLGVEQRIYVITRRRRGTHSYLHCIRKRCC